MKNLAVLNVNDIEVLPLKESRKQYLTEKYGNMYSLSKFDNGTSSVKSPWVFNYNLAKRIIKKYINKPFDDAYSEYCKKAKLESKELFHDFFKPGNSYVYNRLGYYIDDNGFIQNVKKIEKEIIYKVYSWNYRGEYVLNYETRKREYKVISGQVFEFKHKNHLYYKKLYEQRALKRKAERNSIPIHNYSADALLSITRNIEEYIINKQKERDEYNINNLKVTYNKHVWEGWLVSDFIKELTEMIELQGLKFENRAKLKKWCMENQPYYKKYVPDVVNHFVKLYNITN
jgi:hypothetical protein